MVFFFLDPLYLGGGGGGLISNLFLKKLVSQIHEEEAFKFCLDIRNSRALPLDLACPERLNVCSPAVLPYYIILIVE
jgi:hypothetical protein